MDGSEHEPPQPLQMVKSPRAFNAELYDFEFMVRQALLAPARFTHPMRPSQLSAGVMQQRPAVVILHIIACGAVAAQPWRQLKVRTANSMQVAQCTSPTTVTRRSAPDGLFREEGELQSGLRTLLSRVAKTKMPHKKTCEAFYKLGWLMGLEPTTTGITILDSTN